VVGVWAKGMVIDLSSTVSKFTFCQILSFGMNSPKMILSLADATATLDLGDTDDDTLNEVGAVPSYSPCTESYQPAFLEQYQKIPRFQPGLGCRWHR
jgi:hypothetical protein